MLSLAQFGEGRMPCGFSLIYIGLIYQFANTSAISIFRFKDSSFSTTSDTRRISITNNLHPILNGTHEPAPITEPVNLTSNISQIGLHSINATNVANILDGSNSTNNIGGNDATGAVLTINTTSHAVSVNLNSSILTPNISLPLDSSNSTNLAEITNSTNDDALINTAKNATSAHHDEGNQSVKKSTSNSMEENSNSNTNTSLASNSNVSSSAPTNFINSTNSFSASIAPSPTNTFNITGNTSIVPPSPSDTFNMTSNIPSAAPSMSLPLTVSPSGKRKHGKVPKLGQDDELLNKPTLGAATNTEENQITMNKSNFERGIFFVVISVFLLMVWTAQQVKDNPQGVYTACCNVSIAMVTLFIKVICIPCRMLLGGNRRGREIVVQDPSMFQNDLALELT